MPETVVTLDGSMGEGGGQILRSSLTLSLITGRPLRIDRIRAGRPRPGLRRQHLAAVTAAAEVGGAEVWGAALGSTRLSFAPGRTRSGDYYFSIGTAGSTTLVVETILPALLTADASSRLTVEGGTHNPQAPPFEFLARSFLPVLRQLGMCAVVELRRPGFFPAGGGLLEVTVEPLRSPKPLDLLERGEIRSCRARALVASLPEKIGQRELRRVHDELGWSKDSLEVIEVRNSRGPGNVLSLEIESDALTEVFTGFGRRGKRAEAVADEVIEEAKAYLASPAPVGPHLADQLLLPMALAGGGRFRTSTLTRHTSTNMEVLRSFLDLEVRASEEDDGTWRVEMDVG